MDGFVPLIHDAAGGRMRIVVPMDVEMIYLTRLSHGLGDMRLERGDLSRPNIVRFERRGSRLFLVAVNYAWRTSSAEAAQRRAVREAFPESVLWVFEILGEENGGAVVDATEFLLRDCFDIAGQLGKRAKGRTRWTGHDARSRERARGRLH